MQLWTELRYDAAGREWIRFNICHIHICPGPGDSCPYWLILLEWSTVAVNECDLIIMLWFIACIEQRERQFNMSHCREEGVSLGSVWAACYRAQQCNFSLSESVCVLYVSGSCFPGGGPVGWQSCPVVVTVPGAASGTIWPLWKIFYWSDIRAGMQEENQRARML